MLTRLHLRLKHRLGIDSLTPFVLIFFGAVLAGLESFPHSLVGLTVALLGCVIVWIDYSKTR